MPSKSSTLHTLEVFAANCQAYESSEPGPISHRLVAIVYREIQFLITVLEQKPKGAAVTTVAWPLQFRHRQCFQSNMNYRRFSPTSTNTVKADSIGRRRIDFEPISSMRTNKKRPYC